MQQFSYSEPITQEDFDFMKKSNTSEIKPDNLILDYIGIFLALIFVMFLYQHINIDINLSFDNLLSHNQFVFKYKFV